MDASPNNANPKQDPYLGKEIDKYILVEPLGKGGMGLVYKAKHKNIKRLAALKLLTGALAQDEVSIKRLEREASSMGNLQHPNIATMYDFGITQEAQAYIVLELIEGKNLHEIFRAAKSIEPVKLVNYFIQIADAMEYAHRKGLIHRDLKPGNIMITEESDQVKILDFGIARSTEESMMLTKTGQIIGSAAYMSPEQCTGKKEVDHRTDIYALGVMMYQLIVGKLPYKGDTFLQTIFLKTTEHPEPFPESVEELKGLEKLTLKCLMAEPSDRPESMQSIKEELQSMLGISTETMELTHNTLAPKTIQSTIEKGFTKEQLDAIAPDTTVVIDETKTVALDSDTEVQSPATSDKNKKVLIPIIFIVVAIAGFFAFQTVSKSPPKNQEVAKERIDTQPVTDLPKKENLPSETGAAKTDSLMSTPPPIIPVQKTTRKPTKSPKRSSVSRKTAPQVAPKVAPPVVKTTPPAKPAPAPYTAPPRRVSTQRAPRKKQGAGKEIIKSIKHNTRKGREWIRKVKKIF